MGLVTPQTKAQAPAASGWMKTGAASAAAAQTEQAEAQKRKEEMGKAFRFWLEDGEEARITFVDGDLVETPNGKFLLPPRFYEHNLFLNGRWGNTFVCPEKTAPDSGEKCPICESGDRPALVALFTVIDHREYTSKNDASKKYKDTVKLYVATTGVFEQLNSLAQKVGGLAGTTWDVKRTGDKSPRVGNNFFPIPSPSNNQSKGDIAKLQQMYVMERLDPKTGQKSTVTKFVPLVYEQEIIFRTGDQLRQMGLGKPVTQVSGFGPQAQNTPAAGSNYADQL